jgi:hypothetical protein
LCLRVGPPAQDQPADQHQQLGQPSLDPVQSDRNPHLGIKNAVVTELARGQLQVVTTTSLFISELDVT